MVFSPLSQVPRLATRHKFFQELRGYVTDYTECYDEKMATVAYLEGRLARLAQDRRELCRDRRRQDVKDQVRRIEYQNKYF